MSQISSVHRKAVLLADMTKSMVKTPIRVGILVYSGAQQAAVFGLSDMVLVAEGVASELGRKTPVVMVEHLNADTSFSRLDALILPPNLSARRPIQNDWAVSFIQKSLAHDALLCSVCAAAFWLASAGALNGYRATTHWALDDELRRSFQDIRVDTSQIVLRDRNRVTAGGVMAWMDLGLYLLNLWYGPAVTSVVARQLVLDIRVRDQMGYRSFTPPTHHGDVTILKLQNMIARDPSAAWKTRAMADDCAISERTLLRRFKSAVGLTPNVYIQRVRVEAARALFESTRYTVGQVAHAVGYTDVAAFSKTFKSWMGAAPGEYRRRYSALASSDAAKL